MCFLSAPDAGQAHEKSLTALEGHTFPPRSGLSQDLGFQGYPCEGITIVHPPKTPPGGALTPPEQAANRAIASIRRRLEQASGGVKRSRLVNAKRRL